MEMDYKAHVLAIPFQRPGHINPMLQLCKKFVRKGLKTTLAIPKYTSKVMYPKSDKVQIDIISDGYDEGGFFTADPVPVCMARFKEAGSQSILQLIKKYESMGTPIDFIVYDSLLPFVLEFCKEIGLPGVTFFTHQCGMNYIMHQFYHGKLSNPVTEFPVSIQGLPPLEYQDLPYFGSNVPYHFALVAAQFSNINQADYVLVNTYYELEKEVVDEFSKHCRVLTVGPTVPTFYLDRRVVDDKEYGVFPSQNDPSTCLNWLNSKPTRSVVYASLSSVSSASFDQKQFEELALALKNSNYYFLWSVKTFEAEKLPKNFKEETSDKSLLVQWTPQLEVLSSEAVGCILSHCGWNSTLEALSLGVPIVAMPQFADQQPNAKFIQDVWKVGIRVKHDKNELATKEEILRCIKEVMEGETGKKIKENAMKYSNLAKAAVNEGGSSDRNLNYFISKIRFSSSGSILIEEEKAAQNVYIEKIEQEKFEKLAREGPKPEETATSSGGSGSIADVKPSSQSSSAPGVPTDKYRNYAVVAGVVALLGAVGWYWLSKTRKQEKYMTKANLHKLWLRGNNAD